MKKRTWLLMVCALLLIASLQASAEQGSANYLYSPHKELLPVPPAYVWERSLTASRLPGVDNLANLSDATVKDGKIYVLCQDKLLVFDEDFGLISLVLAYQEGGEIQMLAGCTGLFVNPDDSLYITQAEQARILHLNPDFTLKRVLERPRIDGFENVNYRPTKLVADQAGRLYVVAKGMYEGIVELQQDGSFSRFYGVNEVRFNAADLLWRRLATKEQRARQQLWLPTDFTNVAIDKDGFIFATIMESRGQLIKRLNAKGQNILRTGTQVAYPDGDRRVNQSGYGIPTGPSQFIAVDVNDHGVFILLDSTRSRLFAYNEDGRLLYTLGGQGDRRGYFRSPVDVDFLGDRIVVLDQLAQSIEIFAPTDYGRALNLAVAHQHFNRFEEAAEAWRVALGYNHNLTLAYSGIGRSLLREGRYEEALEYLQRGDDREYYSKAYAQVRNDFLKTHFDKIVLGLLAVIILPLVAVKLLRRRHRKEVRA